MFWIYEIVEYNFKYIFFFLKLYFDSSRNCLFAKLILWDNLKESFYAFDKSWKCLKSPLYIKLPVVWCRLLFECSTYEFRFIVRLDSNTIGIFVTMLVLEYLYFLQKPISQIVLLQTLNICFNWSHKLFIFFRSFQMKLNLFKTVFLQFF